MARFQNVIIRESEKLNKMGELGNVLNTIGTTRCRITLPDPVAEEEVPLVYQFCKGKIPGETADVTPDRIIGGVTNIRIDENGNLIGDVRLDPMKRLSQHYKGVIDNILVAKTLPLEEDGQRMATAPATYELKQLIVYDKLTKKEAERAEVNSSMVQKTYNAPTEVYDTDPEAGEKLNKTLGQINEELNKVLENNTWKGHKIGNE